MFKRGTRTWGLFLLVVVASSTSVLGQGVPDSRASSEDLARLEALALTQQNQIARLEQQVAAARQDDDSAARVEALRQQIREVLSEEEFRESLMPGTMQAGYEKGFYIRSSDERFFMRINGRMQFRWTYYAAGHSNRYLSPGEQRDDRTGFDIQRLRLGFRGHLYTPDLTYRVEFRSEASSGYDTRLRDAYLNYRFSDAFQFQAGYFKLAATRQRLLSTGCLQFVDRSLAATVFDLSRGIGVRFWGRLFDKRLDYFFDVANSLNGDANRTITNDPAELDGNPALLFRTVWHALGERPGQHFNTEYDLDFLESPALDLAFHYAFNDDQGDNRTTEIPFPIPRQTSGVGAFGLTNTNGLQLHQFGLASAFKWRGFSASGEYFLRIVDPRRAGRQPYASWWLATRQGDTTVQHGAYAQAGYFLPIPGFERKIEAVGRVGGIAAVANGHECAWEYAGGLNYFIHEDSVTLHADVTKITEAPISSSNISLANVNDQPLTFRVQLEVKF